MERRGEESCIIKWRGEERRGELYHKMSIDSCSDY
jgi:hypothetical protein